MGSVIILSDSHGLTDELTTIFKRHKGEVDGFIHCGDSELPYDSSYMLPYQKVKGNCDFDKHYEEELNFSMDDMKFYVTHGHLYNVKYELSTISYRAEEVGAHIACFGHSHMAGFEKINNILFINPGSIRMPRGGIAGRTPTYVKLTWDERKNVEIEFLNLSGVKVKSFKENLIS